MKRQFLVYGCNDFLYKNKRDINHILSPIPRKVWCETFEKKFTNLIPIDIKILSLNISKIHPIYIQLFFSFCRICSMRSKNLDLSVLLNLGKEVVI